MKVNLIVATVVFSLGVLACKNESPVKTGEANDAAEKAANPYPNSEEGLKKLAQDMNHNGELLAELLPTPEECALIGATAEDADTLAAYLEKLKSQLPPEGLGGKESQTEVLLRSGTTDEMKAGEEKDMAGGYSQTAQHYQSGLTIWAVSYVEPGKDSGMRYDGFVFLNDRWVVLPKFWRAFR